MELTDDELWHVYDLLYDQYFYGQELCYQDTDRSMDIGIVMNKLKAEAKKRKLWWANSE